MRELFDQGMNKIEGLAIIQQAAGSGDKQAAAWLRGEGRIVITRDFRSVFVRFDNQTERLSPRYPIWRKAVFQRDMYACRDCGSTQYLCAHHVQSWADFPELRFDVSNGLTLCGDCHIERHPHLRLWLQKRKRNG